MFLCNPKQGSNKQNKHKGGIIIITTISTRYRYRTTIARSAVIFPHYHTISAAFEIKYDLLFGKIVVLSYPKQRSLS